MTMKTIKNLDAAKAVLRGMFRVIQALIKNKKISSKHPKLSTKRIRKRRTKTVTKN